MKILITENRRIRLIQNYIMSTFPVVDSVDITSTKKTLGSGPNKFGEEGVITINLITVNFKSGEMQISPTTTLRKIMKQVDSIFGLDLAEYGSYWDFDYRMIK
jgi:hypothetical protein